MTPTVRSWCQETPVGTVLVETTPKGVRAIHYGARGDEGDGDAGPRGVSVSASGRRGDSVSRGDRAIARQLDDWFRGRRHDFDVDLDLDDHDLPPLARPVYSVLRKEVPWGETVSYGELASMAGRPGAARAIGSIMRRNPIPFVIPCHRVVGAGGRLGGYGGGLTTGGSLDIKRWLLAHEGVTLI